MRWSSCALGMPVIFAVAVVVWMNRDAPQPAAGPGGQASIAAGSEQQAAVLGLPSGGPQVDGDAFARFDEWRARHREIAVAERDASLAEGVAAAITRRGLLYKLMRHNPARALSRVLPLATLAGLPPEVRAACEQPLSAIGSIDLRWSTTPRDDGSLDCRHQNIAFAGGHSWPVYGPGFADARPPRAGVVLKGYVIDDGLLLAPEAVWRLDGSEVGAAAAMFPAGNPDGVDPVTGHAAAGNPAAVIGGRLFRFESQASVEHVETALAAAAQAAERIGVRVWDHGLRWLEADGGDSPPGGNPPVEPTPWMNDTIDVLFVRVDFSDFPGAPVTQADLQTALGTVKTRIQDFSYNAATINYTVTSQLYRMPTPNTGASYATSSTGSDDLMEDARNAAAANYTLTNYEVVAVYFPSLAGVPGSKITYGGLASIGGGDHWINGVNNSNRVPVILHEFGHNYGLYHANYWDPTKGIAGSYKDSAASSLEYGDIFDRMGGGDETNGYFSPYATNRLNWLPGSKVVQPAADGTWRIYRFDHPSALANPVVALKVPMGGNRYHWVGLRKLYPGAPYNLANAAYVVGEGLYENRPNLIDMTPGSQTPETNDRNDAGLPVGSNYQDSVNGVRFTTVTSGGTAPDEWIEVQIDFDPRMEIVNPVIEVAEHGGNAVVTVRRSFDSAGACAVNFATAAGTATAGADFHAMSGTINWAAGDTSDKTILVPIRPDTVDEGTETFTVTLSSPSGGVLVSGATTATVSIRDAGQLLTAFTAPFFNFAVYAIAPLADGKVVIGGNINLGITGHLARLNADGSEDAGFSKGSGCNGVVRALLVQSDGKILVGGDFTAYNGTACGGIVRLHSNGSVDTSFVTNTGAGIAGSVSGAPGVRAIAVEATGKILLGGRFTTFDGAAAQGLVRLLASGARDTANSLATPFEPGYTPEVRSVIAQEDGKIMAAGSFYINSTGTGYRSGVARLNSDGTRDTSFDPDAGAHLAGAYNNLRLVETILRQPDGKYVIGGQFTAYDENAAPWIARINANGSFDSGFVPPAFNNNVVALLRQPTGAVVAGGWFSGPVGYLERLLPGGAADPTFNQGTGPGGSVYALARDASGAVWVGGNFYSYNGTPCWPLVKIGGGLNAYDAWADTVFTQAQVSAGVTDANDDPDNDGIPNIGELALGTSPNVFTNNPRFAGTTSMVTVGPSRYLQATFDRSAANSGLWLLAQFGTNLTGWSPSSPVPGSNAVYDIIEDSAARLTVRDKSPVSANAKRFVRFVVKAPE